MVAFRFLFSFSWWQKSNLFDLLVYMFERTHPYRDAVIFTDVYRSNSFCCPGRQAASSLHMWRVQPKDSRVCILSLPQYNVSPPTSCLIMPPYNSGENSSPWLHNSPVLIMRSSSNNHIATCFSCLVCTIKYLSVEVNLRSIEHFA